MASSALLFFISSSFLLSSASSTSPMSAMPLSFHGDSNHSCLMRSCPPHLSYSRMLKTSRRPKQGCSTSGCLFPTQHRGYRRYARRRSRHGACYSICTITLFQHRRSFDMLILNQSRFCSTPFQTDIILHNEKMSRLRPWYSQDRDMGPSYRRMLTHLSEHLLLSAPLIPSIVMMSSHGQSLLSSELEKPSFFIKHSWIVCNPQSSCRSLDLIRLSGRTDLQINGYTYANPRNASFDVS